MFIKKKINGIPRIGFKYNSLMTFKYLCEAEFFIPVKFDTFIKQIIDLVFISKGIISVKDEMGILNSHDEFALNTNETMLAVGLGRGISLIHNAKVKDRYKNITIIEASSKVIDNANINLVLNAISGNHIKIIHGYVGDSTNVYGSESMKAIQVDINQYSFDVLELDCEGSEIEILENLVARPRLIIVEMHPMNRKIEFEEFLDGLNKMGYILVKAYTVEGSIVPLKQVSRFFNSEFVGRLNRLNEDSKLWSSSLVVLNFILSETSK
jgi:hypothetical protein